MALAADSIESRHPYSPATHLQVILAQGTG